MSIDIDPHLPAYETPYNDGLIAIIFFGGILLAWLICDIVGYWVKKHKKKYASNTTMYTLCQSKNKVTATIDYIGWLLLKLFFSYIMLGAALCLILIFIDSHHLDNRNDQAKEYLKTAIIQEYAIQPTDGSLGSILDQLYSQGDPVSTPDEPQTLGDFTALDEKKQVMTITVIRENDTIMLYSDGTRLTPITLKD